MNKLADDLKSKNPKWKEDAMNYLKSNGWFVSEIEVAKRISKKAFGAAISKAYNEFSKNGDMNSPITRFS